MCITFVIVNLEKILAEMHKRVLAKLAPEHAGEIYRLYSIAPKQVFEFLEKFGVIRKYPLDTGFEERLRIFFAEVFGKKKENIRFAEIYVSDTFEGGYYFPEAKAAVLGSEYLTERNIVHELVHDQVADMLEEIGKSRLYLNPEINEGIAVLLTELYFLGTENLEKLLKRRKEGSSIYDVGYEIVREKLAEMLNSGYSLREALKRIIETHV